MNDTFNQNKQSLHKNANMEVANELSVDKQAIDTLIATKAGGMITKKLVELGERELMEDAKHNT